MGKLRREKKEERKGRYEVRAGNERGRVGEMGRIIEKKRKKGCSREF